MLKEPHFQSFYEVHLIFKIMVLQHDLIGVMALILFMLQNISERLQISEKLVYVLENHELLQMTIRK